MSQARDIADAPSTGGLAPAGTIIAFGGFSAPAGYLACDGSSVLKADYPELYAVVSSYWGSSTATNFTLPDLRGAFLRGTGSHGTSNMANGNDYAGPSVGSFENDQFQGHRHTFKVVNDNANYSNTPFINVDKTNAGADGTGVVNGRIFDPITDGSNGTPRVGDETRPFNAGVLYCIKT
tara:strand:+ start:433 stop:969 length:537 start_codon:yes stop_codon:yes gene_type:complete